MRSGGIKAHLVLSSGGVKCLSYAGALLTLAEHNLSFASVSACSAGSLVGALLCAGLDIYQIHEHFLALDLRRLKGRRTVWGPLAYLGWPFASYTQSGIPQIFQELVGGDRTFGELAIPFAVAGLDLATNRLLVYSAEEARDMLVSEALKIANAVPFLHSPYEKDGRIIVDAGYASQCPVWLTARYDDDLPIVALQPAKQRLRSRPNWPHNYVAHLLDAGVASRDFYQISQLSRVRVIPIDCGDIASGQVDLSRSQKEQLIIDGRMAASEALARFGENFSNAPGSSSPSSINGDREDRAEDGATRLMSRFNRELPRMMRDHVFVSYSHLDREWFDEFETQLTPFIRNKALRVWADTEIKPGANWTERIEQGLRRTKVALLLVTPNYLKSDFINDVELQYFLKASEQEGLTILWVYIRACAYEETALKDYQAVNPTDKPLAALSSPEKDRVIKDICMKVKAVVTA